MLDRWTDFFVMVGGGSAALAGLIFVAISINPELPAKNIAELIALIKANPGQAAEIYVGMQKDHDISLEDLSDMIGDPDLAYTTAPAGVMRLAEFMQRIGRLKRLPQSWKDVFFPEAHDLSGN